MGTGNAGLFSDDTALDVRDEFLELLREGAEPADATRAMLESWSDAIDDNDEGPVFWLSLAATQWKCGCLQDSVKTQALEAIHNGTDIRKWTGSTSVRKRQSVLDALAEKLVSPQPEFRRPRKRKVPVIPSTTVRSPDRRFSATISQLGKRSWPNSPKCQALVEFVAERSGGGVFVATCEYDEVDISWIDVDTVRIRYPASAVVTDRKAVSRNFDQVINVVYETREND